MTASFADVSATAPVAGGILAGAVLLLLLAENAASRLFNGHRGSARFSSYLPHNFLAVAGASLIPAAFLLEDDVMAAISYPAGPPQGHIPFAASAVILALSSFLYCRSISAERRRTGSGTRMGRRGLEGEIRVEVVLTASASAVIFAASMAWLGRASTEALMRMLQCSFWLALGGIAGAIATRRAAI